MQRKLHVKWMEYPSMEVASECHMQGLVICLHVVAREVLEEGLCPINAVIVAVRQDILQGTVLILWGATDLHAAQATEMDAKKTPVHILPQDKVLSLSFN
uniref:Uncharacterized protein n=1 Tax=Cacopsylla melanoneura TaxID=428564 RepID=A0A8D8YA19_9HEMI